MYHRTKPTRVWVLPVGGAGGPHRLSEAEAAEAFTEYEDTGFEPKLEFLYKAMNCDCVDLRVLQVGNLWLDDEGLFKSPPVMNPAATALYRGEYDPEGIVCGTCILVVHPAVPEGEDSRAVAKAFAHFKVS